MKLSEQLKEYQNCGDFGKALKGYAERARDLEEALALAVRQNQCDMLMTGEELRFCEEVLRINNL